ncbi:MAG: twin-arginine translocase TatA/TatE family subunit [Candidatus Dormibacteria bacterium]
MPFVGTGHIWMLAILGIIALVVFGPGKLPEMGSGLGRAIREFRAATTGQSPATAVAEPAVVIANEGRETSA